MAPAPTPTTARSSRVAALEAALEVLPRGSFLDGPGMAAHGPMGAEALSALGHDDLVVDWVETYVARHPVVDPPSAAVVVDGSDEASWRGALGDPGRLGDWLVLFRDALATAPWREVLATWAPRLIDGYGGFLAHGLLRTAHAVRILEALGSPRPTALDELATGLAFWAGTYRPLPGRVGLDGARPPAEALGRIPRPTGDWGPVDAAFFRPLDGLDGFDTAVEALAPPWSADPLGDLTLLFARAAVAWPEGPIDALIHTVTPVVAARTILRHLPATAAPAVYASAWQVGAGILACFTPAKPVDLASTPAAEPMTAPELVARAVANRAPHAIKMTEACLQEHALRSDPAYLLAAQRAVTEVDPW